METLIGRGIGYLTSLSPNTKIVQTGQTTQSVIDSCPSPAADNLFEVMVPPGHENESYTNRPYVTVTFLPIDVVGKIEQRTYGGNLRRFLKKARDWRAGRRFAQAPHIVMIGDSICGGGWAEDFKAWLCPLYNIPSVNFQIHYYGGYDIQGMLPFIEDTLILPNPDLILFNEYASGSVTDEEFFVIENMISLIKDRTTADIGICTWNLTEDMAIAYLADSTTLIDDVHYQAFNWYRDIASVYNCELIDFNEAVKDALDAGYSIADLGMSGSHLSDAGYAITHLPEIKKHFGLSNDQLSQNIPYPKQGKEEILYLANATKMDMFSYAHKIGMVGSWTSDNISLSSSSVNDTIEVEMNDITGFEILHGDAAGATLQLKEEGGAYGDPSAFQFNSRPLQYISEVISVGNKDDWSLWRNRRPFKKGIITTNELADTVVKSGRYTIKVISIVGETVTCEMFDPDDISLGTFIVGQAATFTAGNLSFPQKYNSENNYHQHPVYPFSVNYLYEFHIHNNWCNTLLAAKGKNKVTLNPHYQNATPPNIAVIGQDEIIHMKGVAGSMTASDPKLSWHLMTTGHTYEVLYQELSREGVGVLKKVDGTTDSMEYPRHLYTFVHGGGAIKLERRQDISFDITFTLSVKDITANQQYESTKKVIGLERGNYVLKMTVTSGVDLFAIRMLH